MDPNAVVLEISSDEETDWDGHDDRVLTGGFDENNWIAELLDEVNREDCRYHDGSDDSDDVVLVSEVLPSRRPRKKLTSKSSSIIELDDECVVLDHDPGKPKEVRNDNPTVRSENVDDDSDDLLVVSETGQVACRDYPHPRHLCIKFPFSSTPNESHCNQCYCYVCDSLAPCLYWGNGSTTIDHCQATEKIEFWKLKRQNSKNSNSSLSNHLTHMNTAPLSLPPLPPPPPPPPLPVPMPNQIPNIINQNRTLFLSSKNKYQPSLVSQQLIRTSSCTIPREKKHHNYTYNRPVFKRTVSPGVCSTGNRHFYSSQNRDSYRNNSGSFPPQYLPFESPDSQPELNSDSNVDNPIPFQPQRQSSLPNYPVPCEASQQGNHNHNYNHGQRSTIDPKFFHGINWPENQTNHLPAAQNGGDSGELVDYWDYYNAISSEPAFIDSVNGRGKWC